MLDSNKKKIEPEYELSDKELLRQKLHDAQTPGATIEFDPDEAERAGCFVETAISEEDAIAGADYPDTLED